MAVNLKHWSLASSQLVAQNDSACLAPLEYVSSNLHYAMLSQQRLNVAPQPLAASRNRLFGTRGRENLTHSQFDQAVRPPFKPLVIFAFYDQSREFLGNWACSYWLRHRHKLAMPSYLHLSRLLIDVHTPTLKFCPT
jgi:hypothetical protein